MNRNSAPACIAEEMGLRREDTTRLRALDVVLLVALVLSGSAWVWVSLVGIEPNLLAALGSSTGRLLAAAVGVASVAAVVRAFIVLRWPVTDNDRGLL